MRFRLALWLDGVVARLSRLRAYKLKRLFNPAVITLEPVRHPATPLVMVVVVVVVASVFSAAGFSSRRIRAPPYCIPNFENSNSPIRLSIDDR